MRFVHDGSEAGTIKLAYKAYDGGDDTLTGGADADTIDGGAGDDTIMGGEGDDILNGGADNDTIIGGAGADTIDGGEGIDTASYAGSGAGVTINLVTNVNSGGDAAGDTLTNAGDTLTNIENLIGSGFADTLTGDDGANIITGGAGGDTIDGGAGSDTASYAGSGAGVTIDLITNVNSGGDAAGDTLTNIENIRGSDHDDRLTGDAGNNIIDGGAGADTLRGNGGDDVFVSAGGDTVTDFRDGTDMLDVGDVTHVRLERGENGLLLLDANANNAVIATLVNISSDNITVDDFITDFDDFTVTTSVVDVI